MTDKPARHPNAGLFDNVVAGLTVSFVAISLGAAFGILSGRGAFAGIISAGVIALITALFGGTRVQCSGPTAPMTAVSAVVVAYAYQELRAEIPTANPEHFINVVFILTGVILVLTAAFRLGRFIRVVPKVVVSGFMNGIAILIWVDQLKKLFGMGGQQAFGGSLAANVSLALVTFALVMTLPKILKALVPAIARLLPGTLLTIVGVTLIANLTQLDAEHVSLDTTLNSLGDIGTLISSQIPREWSIQIILLALPFAVRLAMLGYLDTLLTSLVVDKLAGEQTHQDRELAAQGIANGLVAFVGGIPGAQATIRSVLILKEKATMRLAGVLVGVFVIVEMLIFQDMIGLIPQAVFSGLLFKVGYDVFDWRPVRLYAKSRVGAPSRLGSLLTQPGETLASTAHIDAVFILGTTLVTVLWDLNVAVIGFGALFYLVRIVRPIPDLSRLEIEVDD